MTTDQTGAELQDQLFYPWGQQWTLAGQPYVMHFGGMHQLQDAGLFPTPNRDFTANLGRWMTPDPLAGEVINPQSLNRYAYALNNPTSNTDPSGLVTCPKSDDAATVDPMHPYTCVDVVSNNPPPINVGLVPSAGQILPASSGHEDDGTVGTATNKAPHEVKKQCVDYYRSSPAGKVATFMDPVANLKETLLLETAKFGFLKGLNAGAKASPDLEVLSITGSRATKVVPGVLELVTGWGLGALEKLAPALAVASGTAALADLTVQSTCSSISYGLPPPSPGF